MRLITYFSGLLMGLIGVFSFAQINAQVITSVPLFPRETDSVTIIFDASLGNKGLMDYTGDVYAHTGIIIQGSSQWQHAPAWGNNDVKYKLTRVSTNIYHFKIKPSIREYYGATANEVIEKIAFVFRSGDKTKEGKTETGGDIFYDVFKGGVAISFQKPSSKPLTVNLNDTFDIDASASEADSITLFLDNNRIKSLTSLNITHTFTASVYGKYWVKVIAYKNNLSAADSFYYFVKKATEVAELPTGIKTGINILNDSSLILCLVAPLKEGALVIGDFNNWEPDTSYQMKKTPDGNKFWIELKQLNPELEYAYQFIVDNKFVADPYSHKVLDPKNDKDIPSQVYPNLKAYPVGKANGIVSVFQTKPGAYNWKNTNYVTPKNEDLIIYELLIRDFSASHSFQSVIDSLNYLKKLGISAIELMPVMEFEGNTSWGYNVSFHMALDKYYGTPEKLKQLIDTCHSMGIAVILDMVLNHAFGQSPMNQMYWDAANNRPAANNPWFNPIPKHDYNVGSDFNHESTFTKAYVSDVVKYWLNEFHFDGYRFDLSKGFTQNNTLGNVNNWGLYDASRIAIWKTISDTIWKTNPKAYVILEHFADNTEEKELVNYGMLVWGNANNNYCDAAMGYISTSNFSWGSYKNRGMTKPGLVTYMESHDEERMMYRNLTYGSVSNPNYPIKGNLNNSLRRSELAAAFFFTIPGAKMIWQFGELGYDYSINYIDRLAEKPIKWEYFKVAERKRLYDVYAALIDLKKVPAFSSTDYNIAVGAGVKYININHNDMDVRVVGNFTVQPAEATMNFSKTGWWYDYIIGDSINVTATDMKLPLQISEYRIYTTKRLSKPNITTALKEIKTDNNVDALVYPNPASSMVNVVTKNEMTAIAEIRDLSGRLLKSSVINGKGQIQISELNDGMYLISISQGKNKQDLKLIINK